MSKRNIQIKHNKTYNIMYSRSWSNVMYFYLVRYYEGNELVTSLWMAKNATVVTKLKNLSCAIILIGHLWLQQLVGLSFTCNTSNCTPHLLGSLNLHSPASTPTTITVKARGNTWQLTLKANVITHEHEVLTPHIKPDSCYL